jgi:hypothetical protein
MLVSWNYRVMKHREKHPLHEKNKKVFPEFVEYFAIHEVFYHENELGWTKEPVDFSSETFDGLQWQLDKIKEALEKPILDYE